MKAMHRGEYLYAVQLEQKILTACASQPGFSPFFKKKKNNKIDSQRPEEFVLHL